MADTPTKPKVRKPAKPRRARSEMPKGPRRLMELAETAQIGGANQPSIAALILPDEYEATRLPDDYVAASAVFKAPQVLDVPSVGAWDAELGVTTYSGTEESGTSVVGVLPGTRRCIVMSDPSATPMYGTAQSFIPFNPWLADGVAEAGAREVSTPIRCQDTVVIPRQREDGCFVYEVGWTGATPTGQEFPIYFLDDHDATDVSPIQATVRFYTAGMLVQEAIADTYLTNTWYIVPTTSFDSFSVRVVTLDPTKFASISFRLLGPRSGLSPPYSFFQGGATIYRTFDLDQLTGLALTTAERTTALSGLLTYMGDALHNGGQIAMARVPSGMSITAAPRGDVFGYLSTLPVYAMDGPLHQGAYAWWCPDAIEEFFFVPYGVDRQRQLDRVSSLWFSLRRAYKDQPVRLRVVQHVEAVTRSHTYVTEVGFPNPLFSEAFAVLKELPAVAENPAHKGFFGRLISKVGGLLTKPKTWKSLFDTGVKTVLPFLKSV